MTTWTKENIDKCACLALNDTVMFGDLRYVVINTHLSISDYAHTNSSVFKAYSEVLQVGWDRHCTLTLASEEYGYVATHGDWPEYRTGDYAAATRLVKRLLSVDYKVTGVNATVADEVNTIPEGELHAWMLVCGTVANLYKGTEEDALREVKDMQRGAFSPAYLCRIVATVTAEQIVKYTACEDD